MNVDSTAEQRNPRHFAFVPFDTSGQASIHQDERLVGIIKAQEDRCPLSQQH